MASLPASASSSRGHVWQALTANRSLLMVAFAFTAAMNLLSLTVSLYMLQVYDRVLSSRSLDTLMLLTLIAVAGVSVFGALDSLRLRLLVRIGMRVGDILGARVLRASVALSSRGSETNARQGLRDVETVKNFIGSPSTGALMDAPFLIFFLIVLFLLHWIYFVMVLVGGLILISLALADQIYSNRLTTQSMGSSIRAQAFADDGLRNADVLEGLGMSSTFVSRWRSQWLNSLKQSLRASDRNTFFTGVTKTTRLILQVALLGVGAILILDYHATGGVMIGASIIGARALAPIEAVVSTWKSVIAVRLARQRVDALLDFAPKRDEGMSLPRPKGHLQAEHAGFSFGSGTKPVLANVSFELKPGEFLGVIGPSASGKSTLARLMVGAWPCMAGVVRLDGADLYSWPRQEISRYIGYLPQDVELFGGTVRENIARLTEGDPADIVAAAKLANAHDMILTLPKGYDTDIGERAQRLSGGQRQRVGLARALFGEPRLVVLDEPNSNLDGPGEDALTATLAELKKRGVTVVVIAHRPSILAGMDKILVLREGAVEAFGPRAEVFARFQQRGAAARPQTNVVPLTQEARVAEQGADA
jgi:ATP-binding cassette subfamily C protein/ATP-binding cassette subfamily C protein EexD